MAPLLRSTSNSNKMAKKEKKNIVKAQMLEQPPRLQPSRQCKRQNDLVEIAPKTRKTKVNKIIVKAQKLEQPFRLEPSTSLPNYDLLHPTISISTLTALFSCLVIEEVVLIGPSKKWYCDYMSKLSQENLEFDLDWWELII